MKRFHLHVSVENLDESIRLTIRRCSLRNLWSGNPITPNGCWKTRV